ncbi:MAG: glycosyltransferase family 2 protein [Planctomycetes bacterium]|nr:glycosyltransferase family 2 protein [Planctomycetota bacterium]
MLAMLLEIAMIVLLVVLGSGAMIPAYWGWRMVFDYYARTVPTPPVSEPCRDVVVLLCLRGADPSLKACLHGLLNQDYPRYQIQIIVDSVNDGAWNQVHEILAQEKPGRVLVEVNALEKHCPNCSLKVCAQLQAVARLGPEVEIVALIDADSIPQVDWLRAMTAPLADPTVGATTGIRWYAPSDAGWGSLVRHIYNVGSFPQMFAFDHPWGGSAAIRTELFRKSTLTERWCQALCEDSAVTGPLRELGLKLVWVPGAANINPESIGFKACLSFLQRQILCVRLDHVDWPKLLACNMISTFALAALVTLCGVSVWLQRWDWALIAGGIVVFFAVAMYAGLTTGELVIRRNLRMRGLTPPPLVWTWKMIPAFFLTQALCMYFLVRAHFVRRVAWRGVHYAIAGPGNIRLEKYEPYQPPEQTAPSHHSTV